VKVLAVLVYIASVALAIGFAHVYSSGSMDTASAAVLSFVTGLVLGGTGALVGYAIWHWSDR